MRRKKPASGHPNGLIPNQTTREFIGCHFPNLDVAATLEVFRDKAEAGGWKYSCWQAALRNYLRNSTKYGGAVYRGGREFDPRWQSVLAEARAEGFEEPREHDTPSSYRTRLETWRREAGWHDSQLKARALGVLRRVPH